MKSMDIVMIRFLSVFVYILLIRALSKKFITLLIGLRISFVVPFIYIVFAAAPAVQGHGTGGAPRAYPVNRRRVRDAAPYFWF